MVNGSQPLVATGSFHIPSLALDSYELILDTTITVQTGFVIGPDTSTITAPITLGKPPVSNGFIHIEYQLGNTTNRILVSICE